MAKNPMQLTPTRRDFIRNAALASGAIATAAGQRAEPPARQPNVLMICAAQFRADFIGACNENPSTRTPHLDALGRRRTIFRKAVSNQPLCSPSRASFLTSCYAMETGVWKLGSELNHSLPTIATALRNSGYTAAFMEKWHVSNGEAPGGGKRTITPAKLYA